MQDAVLMFSIDQTVTATADSTNYIPMDVIANAEAKQLTVNCVVSTDFADATDLTVALYETKTTESSGGTVLAQTGVIPTTKLKAGTRIPIHVEIPFRDPDSAGKNLILKYIVGGTEAAGKTTAGSITAGIEYMPQTNI